MNAGCFGAFFLSRILPSRCKFAHLQSRCLVQIAIVGGGAAGFFAAIACARANPQNQISIYERGSEFLTKVRISGGGRCNVTHASFDPRVMSERYPRGDRTLARAHHFATRALALFVSRFGAVAPFTAGRRGPKCGSVGARYAVARTRAAPHHAQRRERPRYSETLRLGRARSARAGLPFRAPGKLAARFQRG